MLAILMTAAAESGEAEKFTAIYERYHRILLRLACSILKEQQAAEDAVQNASLNILRNLDKIDEIDCSKTRVFLIVITRRECYKLYNIRREDHLIELGEDLAGPDTVWEEIEQNADGEALREAMLKLSELDRQLLIGKYAYGYRYRELASLFGLSEKNVSVRLLRAKQKIVLLLKGGEGL